MNRVAIYRSWNTTKCPYCADSCVGGDVIDPLESNLTIHHFCRLFPGNARPITLFVSKPFQ